MLSALLRHAPAAMRHAPAVGALCRAIYPRNDWRSRALRARLALLIWRHLPVHLALVDFFDQAVLRELRAAHPKLLRKIYQPYPCTGLSVAERSAWLMTHHGLALALLGPDLLRRVAVQRDVVLCQVTLPDNQGLLPVHLVQSPRFDPEGDLTLVLHDPFGTALFSLTFSFERTAEGAGLLIGAIHGTLPREVARHLTKLGFGLRPQNLLLYLLQVLAAELGLTHITAVGRARHVYSGTARHGQVLFDYDGFWTSVGAELGANGLYRLPLVTPRRSHDDMPANKRNQYLRRYAWLDRIAADLRTRLAAARSAGTGTAKVEGSAAKG